MYYIYIYIYIYILHTHRTGLIELSPHMFHGLALLMESSEWGWKRQEGMLRDVGHVVGTESLRGAWAYKYGQVYEEVRGASNPSAVRGAATGTTTDGSTAWTASSRRCSASSQLWS